MPELSDLRLAWVHRPGVDPQTVPIGVSFVTARDSLDFVISGKSLMSLVHGDYASCLGWADAVREAPTVERLLMRAPADCPSGRNTLLVCPECGDLGCGAISARIQREGPWIVWRDFAYENNYDEAMTDTESYSQLGPYYFDPQQYEAELRSSRGAPSGRAV